MELDEKMTRANELRGTLAQMEEEIKVFLASLERGVGAREIALVRTSVQEARHWAQDALTELQVEYIRSQERGDNI